MALALMSTLFLISRTTDPSAAIPFADADIRDRVAREQVTDSFFSGATSDGHRVSMSAARILTQQTVGGGNTAEEISIQLDLTSGTRVQVISDTGVLQGLTGEARLSGNVKITTSQGYELTSNMLEARNSNVLLRSPGPVEGSWYAGTLEAGNMRIESREQGQGNTHLLFGDGVRLVYQPAGEGD
jgi:lipopolysaccharide export system protein LptC